MADIHMYISDANFISYIVKECAQSIKFSDSQAAIAGYQ